MFEDNQNNERIDQPDQLEETTQNETQDAGAGGTPAPKAGSDRKKKTAAIACGCAAVLLLGIVGGILIGQHGKSKPDTEEPGSESVADEDSENSVSDISSVSEEIASEPVFSATVEFPDGKSFVLEPEPTINSIEVKEDGETVVIDEYSYDTDDLKDQIAEIAGKLDTEPKSPSIGFETLNNATIVDFGEDGREVDQEKLYKDAVDVLNRQSEEIIQGVYVEIPVDRNTVYDLLDPYVASQIDPKQPEVETDAAAHTFKVTNGVRGWYLDEDYAKLMLSQCDGSESRLQIDMVPIDFEPLDITDAVNDLTIAPVNAYYDGSTIVSEEIGYGADWDAFQSELEKLGEGETTTLTMSVVEPTLTKDGLSAARLRDTIATYTSSVNTSFETRTSNIRTACQRLDSTVLEPGARMSFLNIVGPLSQYPSAQTYLDDVYEENGGGVSQVASALYAAVVMSNMEVTSFTPHRYYVEYGVDGFDADVGSDGSDMVITNTSGYPVRIGATLDGGSIRIQIVGTNVDGHRYQISSDLISATEYDTVTTESNMVPFGETEDTVLPHIGYTFERYRTEMDSSGNAIETVYLGRVTYEKVDHLITVGVGDEDLLGAG